MIDSFICQINRDVTYSRWNDDYKQADIIDETEI
jgi:hypothetical protein